MINIIDNTNNGWHGNVIKPVFMKEDEKFIGKAFKVVSKYLRMNDNPTNVIRRDVVIHNPVVFMLIHDVNNDSYLIEQEYRAGVNSICYGIPAGFIDDNETPKQAAFRETAEETGIIVNDDNVSMKLVHTCHSSQGFTNETAYVYIIDLHDYKQVNQKLDDNEHIAYKWIKYDELTDMLHEGLIQGSNAVVAIQSEIIRRMKNNN